VDAANRPCLLVAVEGERFGLDTARIQTVIEHRKLTPIPGRPHPFLGALNHHGELLPVAHLSSLLGRKASIDRARSVIVVVDWEDALLGLLVERSHGLLTSLDRARPAQVLGRWEGPHLARTLDVDGQTVHVLDLSSLLADVARRL